MIYLIEKIYEDNGERNPNWTRYYENEEDVIKFIESKLKHAVNAQTPTHYKSGSYLKISLVRKGSIEKEEV